MTDEELARYRASIDQMTQIEMARLLRFAPIGCPYFSSEFPLYDDFMARFDALGGMTPAISKAIGW
jgi:hypothetical protein